MPAPPFWRRAVELARLRDRPVASRRRLAISTSVTVILVLAGCRSHPSPSPSPTVAGSLRFGGGVFNPSTDSIPHVARNGHVSVGSVVVCYAGDGSVQIAGIKANGAVNASVAGWAVRPAPTQRGGDLLGEGYGQLAHNGFANSVAIDGTCSGSTARLFELGVEFIKTADENAQVPSFDILYGPAGHRERLHVPYTINLCSAGTTPAGGCA